LIKTPTKFKQKARIQCPHTTKAIS